MLTINLIRQTRKGKAVHGQIVLPFEHADYTFDTLENADFLIPAGTYPLKKTYSPRFKKLLPLIDEVPDRTGIRIHLGTRPEHSTGCVLVNFEALQNINIFIDKCKYKDYDELQLRIDDRLETGRD